MPNDTGLGVLESIPMTVPFIKLASTSPRRRALLGLLGLPFDLCSPDVDETPLPNEPVEDYPLRLARDKALTVDGDTGLVIAADTTVVLEGAILGKPVDTADARRMLLALRGTTHTVISGVVVQDNENGRMEVDRCISPVPMRRYSAEELETYLESGDPLDKAGAYAIQHRGFHPVESFEGCYANVMGLPLCHLTRVLKRLGLDLGGVTPKACQQELQYDCPIYGRVLADEQTG